MNKAVLETVKKIKNLEIQGARSVAVSALEALKKVKKTEEIRPSVKMLARSRPTEPMLRNGLKYIASKMKKPDIEIMRKSADEYISMCENALKEIAEIGSKRIEDKSKKWFSAILQL